MQDRACEGHRGRGPVERCAPPKAQLAACCRLHWALDYSLWRTLLCCLQENVLFGCPYDGLRYEQVLLACALNGGCSSRPAQRPGLRGSALAAAQEPAALAVRRL